MASRAGSDIIRRTTTVPALELEPDVKGTEQKLVIPPNASMATLRALAQQHFPSSLSAALDQDEVSGLETKFKNNMDTRRTAFTGKDSSLRVTADGKRVPVRDRELAVSQAAFRRGPVSPPMRGQTYQQYAQTAAGIKRAITAIPPDRMDAFLKKMGLANLNQNASGQPLHAGEFLALANALEEKDFQELSDSWKNFKPSAKSVIGCLGAGYLTTIDRPTLGLNYAIIGLDYEVKGPQDISFHSKELTPPPENKGRVQFSLAATCPIWMYVPTARLGNVVYSGSSTHTSVGPNGEIRTVTTNTKAPGFYREAGKAAAKDLGRLWFHLYHFIHFVGTVLNETKSGNVQTVLRWLQDYDRILGPSVDSQFRVIAREGKAWLKSLRNQVSDQKIRGITWTGPRSPRRVAIKAGINDDDYEKLGAAELKTQQQARLDQINRLTAAKLKQDLKEKIPIWAPAEDYKKAALRPAIENDILRASGYRPTDNNKTFTTKDAWLTEARR